MINATNEYHILRHYQTVSDKYTASLVNKPFFYYDHNKESFIKDQINIQDLQCALASIGTKFLSNIPGINTPRELLKLIESHFEILKQSEQIKWQQKEGYQYTSFILEYSHPVGNINCLSIESLTKEQKVKVKQQTRSQCKGESDVLVNAIQGIATKTTNKICVQITESSDLPFLFVSAYPYCNLPSDLSLSELVFVI